MNRLLIILLAVSFVACQNKNQEIVNLKDIETHFDESFLTEQIQKEVEELSFWKDKFREAPNQHTYLVKMAGANNALFSLTGNVNYLNQARKELEQANQMANENSAGLQRSLAHTYISHHQFREALARLEIADSLGEGKMATEKMLFDVYMELGQYDAAKKQLDKIYNESDFDYLIRYAKWLDHEGDTEAAVSQLELAKARAESQDIKGLKLWVYSNIADFYGHVGEIEKSYAYYLKTLELDPGNSYVLKGIAWVAFAHDKNPEKSLKILNRLKEIHPVPDLMLLQAEIEEYEGNLDEAKTLRNTFISQVSDEKYGDMYNAYLVTLLEKNPERAVELAEREIANRPTPQSYQLLASAYLLKGEKDAALQVINDQVLNKTYEPKSIFAAAEVMKANGLEKETLALKKELDEARYELGPVISAAIDKL